MVKSMNETLKVPLFNLMDEYMIDDLNELRNHLKLIHNGKLSILPFLIKTFSQCLLKFPKLNSHYYGDKDPNSYRQYP